MNFGSASIDQGWRGTPFLDQAKERVGLLPRASDLPNDVFFGKQSADFVALGTICSKTLKRKCPFDGVGELWQFDNRTPLLRGVDTAGALAADELQGGYMLQSRLHETKTFRCRKRAVHRKRKRQVPEVESLRICQHSGKLLPRALEVFSFRWRPAFSMNIEQGLIKNVLQRGRILDYISSKNCKRNNSEHGKDQSSRTSRSSFAAHENCRSNLL